MKVDKKDKEKNKLNVKDGKRFSINDSDEVIKKYIYFINLLIIWYNLTL